MRVANAPCSWGVLELLPSASWTPCAQVMREMAASGYAGTELGEWGFLPTDAARSAEILVTHSLALVGAFVPVALADPASHARGAARAVEIARLLAEVGGPDAVVVLSDDNGRVPERTRHAGRISPAQSLTPRAWDVFADGAQTIARAVCDEVGARTVFHPHCAGYVETPDEIDALMSRTDPSMLGLCLDTGHLTYGGGDPLAILHRYGSRVWHVHFKDCDPLVAERARREGADYSTAVGSGVFCELGRGSVDFPGIVAALTARAYDGWVVVEQDILPGRGSAARSAERNREYLRALGV